MRKRELIQRLVAGETVERCGFWLGMPHRDALPGLCRYFGVSGERELHEKLGDDVRHIPAPLPGGLFPPDTARPFADCETLEEVERFPWPDAGHLRFDAALAALREAGDIYRLGGYWTSFFRQTYLLFGMEECFMKMLTHPEIVRAVTHKVCGFFYQANQRFFAAAGNTLDALFIGNDLGVQRSMFCGLPQMEAFVLPWMKRYIDLAHDHGYKIVLHSCGSIHPLIGPLIEAGLDVIHPLQAKARDMDAERLARDFKGRITFMGGVDAQELMVHGTPEQIKDDVRRLKRLLGPRLIVSPSHETILPDVPPENVQALAEAALEF